MHGMLAKQSKQIASATALVCRQIGCGCHALREFGVAHLKHKFLLLAIESHHVAVLYFRNHAAINSFGADMDGGWHFARSARHAPIGHQSHLETFVLQHTQKRCEFVQFGHAIGLWTLVAHHRHEIAFELTVFVELCQLFLIGHHHRRCAHQAVLGFHGGHLDHCATDVAFEQTQATF